MEKISGITFVNSLPKINFKANIKDDSFDNKKKDVSPVAGMPVLLSSLYFQALHGISFDKPSAQAIEQSRRFRQDNFISANEKILDGYMDAGSYATYLDNGAVEDTNREVIVVDRKKDTKLNQIIADFKQKADCIDYNEEMLSEFTNQYIYDNFVAPKKELAFDEHIEGEKELLGDIVVDKKPVCRHLALLYKVLADEVGLETDLIRGGFSVNSRHARHAWVRVHEDGCSGFCDPANNIMVASSEGVHSIPQLGTFYYKYELPEELQDEYYD